MYHISSLYLYYAALFLIKICKYIHYSPLIILLSIFLRIDFNIEEKRNNDLKTITKGAERHNYYCIIWQRYRIKIIGFCVELLSAVGLSQASVSIHKRLTKDLNGGTLRNEQNVLLNEAFQNFSKRIFGYLILAILCIAKLKAFFCEIIFISRIVCSITST